MLRQIKTYGCCLVKRGDDMQDSDIEVGDVLRIRQWDDMASEHMVVGDDIYICNHSRFIDAFVSPMRSLCGTVFTVLRKEEHRNGLMCYESVEGFHNKWAITAEMLEPLEDTIDELDIATDEDIQLLFS